VRNNEQHKIADTFGVPLYSNAECPIRLRYVTLCFTVAGAEPHASSPPCMSASTEDAWMCHTN